MIGTTAATRTSAPSIWSAFGWIGRGLLWAVIGFGLGAGALAIIRLLTSHSAWSFEASFSVGYVGALAGWLLGVGAWERWGREWLGRPIVAEGPRDWRRYFAFTTDHKVIGIQYLATFVVVFLLSGLLAMLIRVQMLNPVQPLLDAGTYNRVMSMHGILMIAVAVASIVGGFGNYVVPLLIGAEDMAFPRLNALSYWLIPPVAILLLLSQAFGGWDSGWTAYAPLSEHNASGQTLFNLAIITFGLSSILGGLNFIATIVHLRARGMSWSRIPIFVWSIFVTSWIALLYTQFFAAALLMVQLDRIAGTSFFNAAAGGTPLLYQHVFWFYSHPAVYVMALPGFGIVLEILPHFARKPLYAYRWAIAGFLGILLMSGGVWAHHMFVAGMSETLLAPFLVTTEIISIPTGLVFLSALGTIWMGRLWLRPPMLFALGMIFNFLIGGITGVFLADVPTDIALHDTYFVVAHFHYTIIGGEIFALFAALYYWFPKMTGRMYDETLAQIHFWLMMIGFNGTFLPMFWLGLHGMNRRVATYPVQLQGVNELASLMGFVLGSSFLFFVANMVYTLRRGPKAAANPWGARTLEWQTSSPPPVENFPHPPVVAGHPYDYGVPGSIHGVIPRGGTSEALA